MYEYVHVHACLICLVICIYLTYVHNVIVQLEEKCFVQQEKIANYEDDLMKERTIAESNEEQLKKTMNKVCWTNSPVCVCVCV